MSRLEGSDKKYEVVVTAHMYDSKNVLVAETNVTWVIGKKGPRRNKKKE